MEDALETAIDRLRALQPGKRVMPLDREAHLANYRRAKGTCGEINAIFADLIVEAAKCALSEVDLVVTEADEDFFRAGQEDALHDLLVVDETAVLKQMEAA